MIPTEQEYLAAKEICNAYEQEQKLKLEEKILDLKKELKHYFDNNKVGCGFKIREFDVVHYLNSYDIEPIDPPMEESYEGQNDDEIEAIGKKYGVELGFVYWVYHK